LEENLDNPLSDLIRLKYVQTEQKDLDKSGRWRMVQRNYYLHYVNDKALPRAFLVGKAVASPDPQSSTLTIQKGWSDPREQVLLTTKSVPHEGQPGFLGEAQLLEYGDTKVVLKAEAPRPCYLFLSDNHYPGWKALVNGQEVPLYGAKKMVYRNSPLLWGLALSLAAWLGLAAVWVWGRGLRLAWSPTWTLYLRTALFLGPKAKGKKR
jgi:hypothetical protein